MSKIAISLVVLFVIIVFSSISLSQPRDLTDRELLIQLYSKMQSIDNSVHRIEDNSKIVTKGAALLEKRVTKNEINISGFYEKLGELVARWNTLLGLFVVFVTTIFIWMWKKVYNGKNNKLVKNIK